MVETISAGNNIIYHTLHQMWESQQNYLEVAFVSPLSRSSSAFQWAESKHQHQVSHSQTDKAEGVRRDLSWNMQQPKGAGLKPNSLSPSPSLSLFVCLAFSPLRTRTLYVHADTSKILNSVFAEGQLRSRMWLMLNTISSPAVAVTLFYI